MKIKTIYSIIGLFLAAVTVHASGEGWLTDFDKAISEAKKENKIIMVEFHGSDWCPPCIKLNKEVLSTDAFKSLAEESLVLVNADFPRKSKLPEAQSAHNQALAEKFDVKYFPTVLLIGTEGQILDKMVGFPKGGLEGFLAFIKDKAG